MCGIAGYSTTAGTMTGAGRLRSAMQDMRHRGPDDEGLALIEPTAGSMVDLRTEATMAGVVLRHEGSSDGEAGHTIGLGHRRFALVDPGPQGHQPFWSSKGDLCLTWNGEIYNYVELRGTLEGFGHRFSTNSDTEVLLAAYREWGTGCFEHLVGFWALALYDAGRAAVLLSRDRLGKAPLYVCRTDSGTFWASEIQALRTIAPSPAWTVRETSVACFLRWGVRDIGGTTFYNEVQTFPAASYAWLDDGPFEPKAYWRLPTDRLRSREISPEEAAREVRESLIEAIRVRLRADVPVGVQVSGGLDSSSILALTAGMADKVDAYTVAFDNPQANEEPFARAVAEKYPATIDYHVLSPPLSDPLDRLGGFVELMGEPFHSPNQLTNHAIWETIRSHGLRGVLYGAGGDEVFLGYPGQYAHPYIRWLLRNRRPATAVREFARFPKRYAGSVFKDVLVRGLLTVRPTADEWLRRRSVPPEIDPCRRIREDADCGRPPDGLEERQRANLSGWLIPYWTRIDNQNSMGVPIELRCPFLDHRIVELGLRLPMDYFIHEGWTKWILRVALDDDLPEKVAWRREKMGFPFPLSDWLDQSKVHLMSALADSNCPFVDPGSLDRNYDLLRQADPNYLWYILSLSLWWRSSVTA